MRTRMIIAMVPSLLFGAASANAHAFLDHANPRVGNAVRTAPREVTLWFTQDLEPAFRRFGHQRPRGGEVRPAGWRSQDRACRS